MLHFILWYKYQNIPRKASLNTSQNSQFQLDFQEPMPGSPPGEEYSLAHNQL